MLKLTKIAVTGGIACGKSSVCHIFAELGAYVLSADEIVHQLLSLNTHVGKKVVRLLGSDILEDGFIDRKKVAEKVFSQPNKLKALEAIIHPVIIEEIESQYRKIKEKKEIPFFVVEMPLVYESNFANYFDYVLCVVADPRLCSQRFMQKTNTSQAEYENRMKFQMPLSEKAAKSNFTIVNNGDLTELKKQVYLLLEELRSK